MKAILKNVTVNKELEGFVDDIPCKVNRLCFNWMFDEKEVKIAKVIKVDEYTKENVAKAFDKSYYDAIYDGKINLFYNKISISKENYDVIKDFISKEFV